MKKIVILAAIVSSFILAGCASKDYATEQNAAASNSAKTSTAPVHHDYKGETQ